VFPTKSDAEESSILFNASESTYSDVNNGIENALKLDCSAYSTMYPNFLVLLVKISILIAYSSKGAQDNNCKKQQKSHLVLMCFALMYM